MSTEFVCNKCGNGLNLLDRKCDCGGVYIVSQQGERSHSAASQAGKVSLPEYREHSKPSAKCYSVGCPAIWFNKCTSTKYEKCGIRNSE